jgi:hypothetical protein
MVSPIHTLQVTTQSAEENAYWCSTLDGLTLVGANSPQCPAPSPRSCSPVAAYAMLSLNASSAGYHINSAKTLHGRRYC